jgi:sialic acid synthase SpsE
MHMGDKSLAYELIRKAKLSGATIAKFQLGWTKEAQLKYAGNYDERRYIDDWAEDLAKWCDHFDIEFMASIWSMEGLEIARSVDMKWYKIAHQMDDEELVRAINEAANGKIFNSAPGGYIYAHHDYPIYGDSPDIPYGFGDTWKGYSSHAHGIADALIAVARGAEYIEKHLALNKAQGWPRDASFALLPSEFAEMVRIGDEIARLR